MRHRHEGTIARFPTTATAFPSQVQIQQAYDFLSATGRLDIARRSWGPRHRNVFDPMLPFGDAAIFTNATPANLRAVNPNAYPAAPVPAPIATPAPGPRFASSSSGFTANAARARTGGATATPGSGSGSGPGFHSASSGFASATSTHSSGSGPYHSSGSTRSRSPGSEWRPRNNKSRRTATTGTGSSPASSAFNDPVTFSSSEGDGSVSPTPAPRPRTRGSRATANPAPAPARTDELAGDRAGSVGARAAAAGPGPGPGPGPVAAATGAAAAARGPRGGNRSGGNATRNVSINNPVTNERISVGTWRLSAGATANIVVAGFDARGRIFYRVTNMNMHGNTVPAPNATATRFENIVLRAPYQGMDATAVRLAVDAHLRINPYARP